MNTHGGQPKGWVGQTKTIPSFRTRSLKMAFRYLPWNPVVVKYSRVSIGWWLHLQYGPQAHFVFPSEPWACTVPRSPNTWARARTPLSTVATPLGIEKLIPVFYNLSSLIILLFPLHYLHSLHLFHTLSTSVPNKPDNNRFFTAYVSFKPGGRVFDYCHPSTYLSTSHGPLSGET